MKLVELRVRRLPGIEHPFDLRLGPGVQLVEGPNTSGKTSLVRAVRALLWPGRFALEPASLSATWDWHGERWTVEREGERVTWQRDGVPSEPPPLPDAAAADCLAITLDELLSQSGDAASDGGLAREVLRQMSGGYDVRAVRGGLDARPRAGAHERRGLEAIQRRVQELQRGHAELAQRLDGLPELERRRDTAREARDEAQRVRAALELAGVRDALARLDARGAELPAGLATLRGDELAALEDLRREAGELADERASLERERDELARRGAAAGEPPGPAPDLSQLERRVERLRELERECDALSRDEASARGVAERARAALRELLGDVEPPQDLGQGLDRAEAWLARAEDVALRRRELEARLRELGHVAPRADLRRLSRAQSLLLAWLRASDASRRARHQAGLVAALVLLVAAGAVALALVHHPLWIALLAAALGLWALAAQGAQAPRGERAGIEAALERLGAGVPERWDVEAAEAALDDLQEDVADAVFDLRRAGRREEAEARLAELQEVEGQLAAERAELWRRLGGRPRSDSTLVAVHREVVALAQARETSAEHRAVRGERAERHAAELARAVEDLARAGEGPVRDSVELAAALRRIDAAGAERRAVGEGRARVERALAGVERREAAVRERERRLLAASGAADEAELARRVGALDGWRRLERERERGRAERARLEGLLEGRDDLLGMPRARAARLAEVLDGQAAEHDALVQEIADLRARADERRARADLEQVLAERDEARGRLLELRENALEAEAARALLDDVETQRARGAHPEVLDRARALFAAFTRHAFELVLASEADAPAFRAVESASGRGLALDELSTGTRVQLFLAARLAHVASLEARTGNPLPIFLDEALSTSDPTRFRAVAQAFARFTEDGERQVVYLTSRPSDAALWREVAFGAARVDLGRVRRFAAAEPDPLAPAPVAVQEPGGRSPEEYARALGVPPLDPLRPAEELHLHYVARDDLELLARLLAGGVERLGQLRALERHAPALLRGSDERSRARLLGWARATEAFVDGWRVGRGRPVTRDVLERADVGAVWLDGLAALAAELEGDAAALVRALAATPKDPRIKGFRAQTAERLEEFLEREGHLDPRRPLTEDELYARWLDAAAPLIRGELASGRELRERFDWLLALARRAERRRAEAPA